MGRPEKGKVPPPAIANLELMKVSCLFVCTIGGHHCALSFFFTSVLTAPCLNVVESHYNKL